MLGFASPVAGRDDSTLANAREALRAEMGDAGVADEVITGEGLIDMKKLRPVGRLGYYDYTIVEPDNIFARKTPDDDRFAGDDSKGWDEIQPRVEESAQE